MLNMVVPMFICFIAIKRNCVATIDRIIETIIRLLQNNCFNASKKYNDYLFSLERWKRLAALYYF